VEAAQLARRHANAALEPLPSGVNERDGGEGRAANLRGKASEFIEFGLGWRVEDVVAPQSGKAFGLVRGDGSGMNVLSEGAPGLRGGISARLDYGTS
jgi:hypothetical protein